MAGLKEASHGKPMVFNLSTSASTSRVYTLNPLCGADQVALSYLDAGASDPVTLAQSRTLVMTEARQPVLQFVGAAETCRQTNDQNDDGYVKVAFSAVVQFVCNEELAAVNSSVSLTQSSECTATFTVATALACPPALEETACIVNDAASGKVFDLSRLSRRNEGDANWEVLGKDAGCGTFEMNVCAPLIQTSKLSSCPHSTAVCARKDGYKPQSVGSISQGGGLNARIIVPFPARFPVPFSFRDVGGGSHSVSTRCQWDVRGSKTHVHTPHM
jgi:hypothetical protein